LYFHFHELEHLLVVDHVALVEEHHEAGNVHLTGEQHVLTSLWHRAVSGSHHEDGTVHLGSTSNHVLHIVGVTRAVHVSIVTLLGLILHVSSIDGNTTLLLLGSVVTLVKGLHLVLVGLDPLSKHLGDSCGQGSLTMVHVTDGTNVHVRFSTHKCFFSHCLLFVII
jgi:hypothetical protein